MSGGIPQRLINRIAALEAQQNANEVRAGGPVIADLTDKKFPHQLAFLEDTSQMIALLCTRRAAKSFSAGKRLIRAMYRHPGCSVLFIGLTKESAKKILWKDVLKVINRRWDLQARFNDAEQTMTMPNGSVLYLTGADASEDEMEKMLGQKYAEVVIDEGASYRIDLHRLVYGILKPAVADYRGTICIVGTPGNLKRGLFFDLTEGQDPREPGRWSIQGFSCHRWSTTHNPYMAENWKAEIDQLIADNPRIEETPSFQQNFWGVWVIDSSKLVYRYESGRNDYDGELPVYERGSWHFGLAIDLGFTDACSFTVSAYHDHDRNLYFPLSYKRAGLDITATAEHANELKSKYPIEHVIIDGANKQAVEELNNRHELNAECADKTGKADFVDQMNAEMIQGRVKLGPDAQDLRDEYAELIWDERKLLKGKREEHPGCANHCFIAGTMVRTLTGEVAIEEIRPGDLVWTRLGLRKVTAAGPTGIRDTWRLESASGAILIGTAEHPVWTAREWQPLSELTKDDFVSEWCRRGSAEYLRPDFSSRVRSVSKTGTTSTVFNLAVADVPEFYANGILVHNCADGALYRWRHTWQYLSTILKKKPAQNTEAFYEAAAKADADEMTRQMEEEMQRNATELKDEQEASEWI